MLERFTQPARVVIVHAAACARGEAIDSHHVLCGLVLEREGLGAEVLRIFGVTRDALEIAPVPRPSAGNAEKVTFSHEARSALEQARREAKDLGDKKVDTGHLLLALTHGAPSSETRAALELARLGVSIEGIRLELVTRLVT